MQLILLGTSACHLCEQAQALLAEILIFYPQITLAQIDIAEQSQWQERYATKIPVLLHPASQQELGWLFDQAEVINFITRLNHD